MPCRLRVGTEADPTISGLLEPLKFILKPDTWNLKLAYMLPTLLSLTILSSKHDAGQLREIYGHHLSAFSGKKNRLIVKQNFQARRIADQQVETVCGLEFKLISGA